jgi:hypothetical protein
MDVIRGFGNLPRITLSGAGKEDDVFIDRLNYKYTTAVLFISSISITIKILQSDHIQCWVAHISCDIHFIFNFIFYFVIFFKGASNSIKIRTLYKCLLLDQ